MAIDALDAAWDRLWEALPARWRVGRPSHDAGRGRWHVTAFDSRSGGRGRIPRWVTGTGETEAGALLDLDARLRGAEGSGQTRIQELRARARLAYVSGAEGWARAELGRGLSADELSRVLGRLSER